MCAESLNEDDVRSKEVKDARDTRSTSTVYTVDSCTVETAHKSMNGAVVNYCDDQSPLATLTRHGRPQSVTASSTDHSHLLHGHSSLNSHCLRPSHTCSPAEVVQPLSALVDHVEQSVRTVCLSVRQDTNFGG